MHNFNILHFNLYNLLFYFLAYSFLGWCVEVLYAYKNQKKFVNRGFLHGPLCPIYGSCILSLILLFDNFKNNILTLFILATILTSTIEYLTSVFLEKLFKKKWWDYTSDPFNLHGRICLHFSLMWGAASVGVVLIVHPIINFIISSIPVPLGIILFYALLILLIFDITTTLKNLIDFKRPSFNFQLDTGYLGEKYSSFLQNTKGNLKLRIIEKKLSYLREKLSSIYKK